MRDKKVKKFPTARCHTEGSPCATEARDKRGTGKTAPEPTQRARRPQPPETAWCVFSMAATDAS
ncbi:hypothetical protein GCM10027427_21050 [Pseudoclavibacter terrae]